VAIARRPEIKPSGGCFVTGITLDEATIREDPREKLRAEPVGES
jgi:hypothetical protein